LRLILRMSKSAIDKNLTEKIERVVIVDPAEEVVQMSWDEELPVGHHVLQLELGWRQSQHLVTNQSKAVIIVGMLLLKF